LGVWFIESEIKRLHDATNNLVNQQFYDGDNKIIGRTPKISVKINASGQIIQKFKELFIRNINFFLEGNYLDFLLSFKKITGINEKIVDEIYEELKDKIEVLKENEAGGEIVILYTMVLSTLISKIRDIHFNNSIEEIKRRINVKNENVKEEQIQNQLNQLFMRNNENISILYNLSYLDALASSFNYKKVVKVCKIQMGKYINRIVNLVLSNL